MIEDRVTQAPEEVAEVPPPFDPEDDRKYDRPRVDIEDALSRPFSASLVCVDLFMALVKAQGAFPKVLPDSENKHLKNKYASLDAYIQAIKKPMAENGLAIVQIPDTQNSDSITIQTLIIHESGQWMSNLIDVPADKPTAQGLGSALTYARRYALCSMLGLSAAAEDTDGVIPGAAPTEATLTDEQIATVYNTAVELFGDDADKELAKSAKLLFRVDNYSMIPGNMYDTLVEQLTNRANGLKGEKK